MLTRLFERVFQVDIPAGAARRGRHARAGMGAREGCFWEGETDLKEGKAGWKRAAQRGGTGRKRATGDGV